MHKIIDFARATIRDGKLWCPCPDCDRRPRWLPTLGSPYTHSTSERDKPVLRSLAAFSLPQAADDHSDHS
jgi:hypothetical protein